MTPEHIAVAIAALLFMRWLAAGRERQTLIRCTMCGTRYGEKHHAECPWKDKR